MGAVPPFSLRTHCAKPPSANPFRRKKFWTFFAPRRNGFSPILRSLRSAKSACDSRDCERCGQDDDDRKLAQRFKDEGHGVLLPPRIHSAPPPSSSSEVWAKRSGAEFVRHEEGSDPAAVAFDACEAAKARGCDIVLIDTAGRLQNKDYLMEELRKIVRVMKKLDPAYPQDVWLVIDGNTGQNTINQTKIFNQSFPLTGLVVTKLDGTACGGAPPRHRGALKIPIRWVGMGERMISSCLQQGGICGRSV